MESAQLAQLVVFVLLVSIPLLFLEAGMRRARRQRHGRHGGSWPRSRREAFDTPPVVCATPRAH